MAPTDPVPLPGAGGAGTDEPTEASVVRAFLASIELLDVDRAVGYLADDVVYQNVSLPAARGRAATERLLRLFVARATAIELTSHRLVADGPVVLTERTDVLTVGRLRVPFWVCGTFEVHDGRITLWRDYFDWANVTAGLVRGLVGTVLPRRRVTASG